MQCEDGMISACEVNGSDEYMADVWGGVECSVEDEIICAYGGNRVNGSEEYLVDVCEVRSTD